MSQPIEQKQVVHHVTGIRHFMLAGTLGIAALWLAVGTTALAQLPPAVDEAAPRPEEEMSLIGDVNVSEYLSVTLHVQDTELSTVLRMLSMQSQKNIIANSNVAATVTADLYDVTFYEALDAILHANGYGYVEEGSFIYVYTQEELQTILDAQKKVSTRVYQLNYLNASDASTFVTELLSENGSIAFNGEVTPGFKAEMTDGGADSFALATTLVVHDYEENLDEITDLLSQIDKRPQQVLVEATVLQTNLSEDNAWGIDFNVLAGMNFTDLTDPRSAVDELINGSTGFQPGDNQAFGLQNTSGRTSAAGGLKIGVVSDDISIFLRVLDEVTDATVLSRPKVLALNRNRGEILIGRRLGYLSTTATQTSTTQTVEFLDTGTQLNFRPWITNDGFIRMELKPSVSEGIIREVTTADGQSVTIPDEITQELTTNVVVQDGYTIVLGGLFKEETTVSRRQIPILGDIPLLGAAFRGHDDSTRRSEIIFLITPTIMKDEPLLAEGLRVTQMVELACIGARKGVLPWSMDRLTTQHNMRAEEAWRNGDAEMALWELNQSLSLRRNQPLVLALRERVTGEHERTFNRCIMRDMMTDHLERMGVSNGYMAGEVVTFVPVGSAYEGSQEVVTETFRQQPTQDMHADQNDTDPDMGAATFDRHDGFETLHGETPNHEVADSGFDTGHVGNDNTTGYQSHAVVEITDAGAVAVSEPLFEDFGLDTSGYEPSQFSDEFTWNGAQEGASTASGVQPVQDESHATTGHFTFLGFWHEFQLMLRGEADGAQYVQSDSDHPYEAQPEK